EHLLEEIKSLAQWVRFECRHRLLHSDPEYEAMDRHLRGFHRARNLRMLFYAAKLAIVALKARELLEGRSYPTTRLELRQRLTDPDDVALVDLVEEWPLPRESYPGDVVDLALLLDRSTRRLGDWLETRDTRVSRRVSRVSKGPGGEVGP
ncbi:MAG: hypothetical protein HYS09_03315, partial [Chloroflexi bacterium]|nr:hypothetical protein [Chloroflexota bacterium]